MRWVPAWGLALCLALHASVAHGGGSDLERGAALLAPFKRDLQAALRTGLVQGPAAAVEACRAQAPQIEASLAREGVRLGRTSHRLRNPANVAPDWVQPILEAYLADASKREPVGVAVGAGRAGYVEPILLQPLCATCHGESLAADVAAKVRELYPDDRAVGFRVGDLRGVFWAEFPASEAP